MANYADLEIRILAFQGEGYPVELTLNSEQEFPRGYLDPSLLPWVPTASPSEDGERLFAWLFSDARLNAAWAEVRGQQPQRRIRLRIDASAPELHAIPWELLRDPGDRPFPLDLAAGTATPFSRYLAGHWLPGSPILKRPLKILVAIANPDELQPRFGLESINLEEEWAILQESMAGLDAELVLLPEPCTLVAIETHLRNGFHVLHFIGHGRYGEKAGKSVLLMADEENQIDLVSDVDFAAMLGRQLANDQLLLQDRLRLVFLASCQTATRSSSDAFRGFAPKLVAAGVPAVLAMQDLVPVDTARQFAATFYRQLLQHGQVDLASNEARSALLSAGMPGAAIPVLFSRLRSSQLLGQRGRITSPQEDMFWPFLIENIERGQCTPFLGPGVTAGLLPDRETMAEKLADRYGYPFSDRRNLVRVAQFMDINDPGLLHSDYLRLLQRSLFNYLDIKPTEEQKRRFRNATFTETAEGLVWAERVMTMQENEIHHLLADLRLPLYVTTNPDSFMFEALKHKLEREGMSPRRVGPRWEQLEAGTPQYVLTPDPSPEQPVVLHLNGHDGDPDQLKRLVLSEDDYLDYFVRLSRDQEMILPMNVLGLLSEHSFLFLGYQLDDWEFRTILQGLIKPIAQTKGAKKTHVGVQLGVEEVTSEERAMEYLGRYLGQFNIDIYWGTAQQFVTELNSRWHEWLGTEDDDW